MYVRGSDAELLLRRMHWNEDNGAAFFDSDYELDQN